MVLLVEVKSSIPTGPVRLGTLDAADVVLRKLGKAFRQIDVTTQLIADRDPAHAAVPAGRPVFGLAVRLEPFHMANAVHRRRRRGRQWVPETGEARLPAGKVPSGLAAVGR
jgi:hypothetical protein